MPEGPTANRHRAAGLNRLNVACLHRRRPVKGRDSGMPEEHVWAEFFQPQCVLTKLDCTGCRDIVEFGCGYGTFTIPAGRLAAGRVIAFDIEPAMVAHTAH